MPAHACARSLAGWRAAGVRARALRGAYAGGNAAQQTRAWKLFLLVSRLLLVRAREPGTIGRDAILQRSRDFIAVVGKACWSRREPRLFFFLLALFAVRATCPIGVTYVLAKWPPTRARDKTLHQRCLGCRRSTQRRAQHCGPPRVSSGLAPANAAPTCVSPRDGPACVSKWGHERGSPFVVAPETTKSRRRRSSAWTCGAVVHASQDSRRRRLTARACAASEGVAASRMPACGPDWERSRARAGGVKASKKKCEMRERHVAASQALRQGLAHRQPPALRRLEHMRPIPIHFRRFAQPAPLSGFFGLSQEDQSGSSARHGDPRRFMHSIDLRQARSPANFPLESAISGFRPQGPKA